MPKKLYKMELIEWYDAQADCSWCSEEEVDRWMKDDFLALEVGWVIRETKDMVVMTSCFGNDGCVGNRTKIPKPWIKTRKMLSPTKKQSCKKKKKS